MTGSSPFRSHEVILCGLLGWGWSPERRIDEPSSTPAPLDCDDTDRNDGSPTKVRRRGRQFPEAPMCARRERGAPSPRGRRLLCPRPWGLAGLPSSSGRAPAAPAAPAFPSRPRPRHPRVAPRTGQHVHVPLSCGLFSPEADPVRWAAGPRFVVELDRRMGDLRTHDLQRACGAGPDPGD